MNNVFSCISWWACIVSDQYFKSQQHYLKPGYIIQLIAFQWDTPSSPDPSLLVKWVGPSPVARGVWAQHYFRTDSRVVVNTWNNKILFTCPTLTVILSPNHPAAWHCWRRWCTALPLTHQPTLQYNIKRRRSCKLQMTYSMESYMKNSPNLSSPKTLRLGLQVGVAPMNRS